MLKKLLLSVIVLIALSAGVMAYSYSASYLNAASATTYIAGGNVTGRVNKMPSGLTSSTSGLQKGDKILTGVTNPGHTSEKIAFQLLVNHTYTDYGCLTASTANPETTICNKPAITSWLAATTNDVGTRTSGMTMANLEQGKYSRSTQWGHLLYGRYVNSTTISPLIKSITDSIKNDNNLLTYRSLYPAHDYFSRIPTLNAGNANNIGLNRDFTFYSTFAISSSYNFTLDNVFMIGDGEWVSLPAKDLAFKESYGEARFYHDSYTTDSYNSVGTITSGGSFKWAGKNTLTNGYQIAIRPFAYLNLSNTVFAVSRGGASGVGVVKQPNLPSNYSNIYMNATGSEMKLRLENSSLNSSTKFLDIQDKAGISINKVVKNKTVYLDAQALAGSSSKGVNTVSVLVFDTNNNFVYYKPLENAKGSGIYEFDLTGIAAGHYKIGIVNEVYNESTTTPSESSAITQTLPLEIVEPVSVSATPKTGLEYKKNVNQNDVVATFTTKDGIDPITTTLVSDTSVSGHSDDYQYFRLDGNEIKVDRAEGLVAGDYYFKLNAIDVNGDPIGGASSATIHIHVDKANLSVVFDDPNQTKKNIAQATTGWNETATATPSDDIKITYSVSGGSVALITIDPDTGRIIYAGGGGFGKVTIKAIADDDPKSGYDAYNSAETTKEIVIYREVDGTIAPHENSSGDAAPTFKTTDPNIKPNGEIGTITGILGMPDNGVSGATTYTYGLKNVDNYNYFSVNSSTGKIITTADLSATTGTYHITVTVSDKWSTKEIPVTIMVGLAAAEDLKFYENSTSNTIITTKSVKSTETGVSVFATVKGSSNTNQVTYKVKDGSTNVITINPNSGKITINGVGTITIVAEKQGASGQADAMAELTFTVTAGEQDFIYTDVSKNKLPQTGNKYDEYKETYAPGKTFQLYTDGNPSGSTVTYQLKTATDVISVDANGLVHILNASRDSDRGKVIVQATSHDPSGTYSDKTIELPIMIEQGTRTIEFAEDPTYVSNGTGSITPNILVDGKSDNDANTRIEVDSAVDNSIAWTNDGKTIYYDYSEDNGKDVLLHVTKPGDRNYKAVEGTGVLHIIGAKENVLTLSTPGKVIYGDHFEIQSTQDDSTSTDVKYTFETDNQVFISAPKVSGNIAEFDALAYSGNTQIKITVTRTASGEQTLTKTVQIKVLPKPITITIDDKEKKRLEDNPPLTYQDFTSQLVSWNGVRDTIDESVIKLSTTAKKYSPIGSYPITAGNAQKQLNDNYPNYTFTIKQGLLNVLDNGNQDFWDEDNDGCPDLNIKFTDENGNEIIINGDLNDDGIPDYNVDTNGDGKPDLNIDTDNDDRPDVNLVILKEWKPTVCVTMPLSTSKSAKTKEMTLADSMDEIQYASGISAKAEINIDLNNDWIPDIDIDNRGDYKAHINVSRDGQTPFMNITEMNTWEPLKNYQKGTFLYDSIGEDQEEYKPELNIDTDDDGRPDINLDLDNDGDADLNIDRDGDNIPDVDIDSDGDGIADICVDLDGDGIADKNIIKITEWKPEHNVDGDFPYDTMSFDPPSTYPGKNVGGAQDQKLTQTVRGVMTGDTTNIMMYLGFGCMALGMMFLVLYKQKEN